MSKNIFKNNNYLLDENDDEIETINWIEPTTNNKNYNCGCCDNCLCYDNKSCDNCGCNCNNNEDNSCNDEESDNLLKSSSVSNFTIKIINDKEKKVRITLQLKINLSETEKTLKIDVDINKETYLKIADELVE
jgi:hypothetical protein